MKQAAKEEKTPNAPAATREWGCRHVWHQPGRRHQHLCLHAATSSALPWPLLLVCSSRLGWGRAAIPSHGQAIKVHPSN